MEKNMKNNTDTIRITESLAACQRVTHSDSAVLQLKIISECHLSCLTKSLVLSFLGQMHGKANYYVVKEKLRLLFIFFKK